LGTGIYDFDNDGLLDILIFHGGLIHLIPQEHTVFRGMGDGRFADVSATPAPFSACARRRERMFR